MAQLNVLYIDDEAELCSIFADEYSSSEILVTTFTDVQTGIDHANKYPPDVIFLDNRLPGTSGEHVALAMNPKIPKYLITGDGTVNCQFKFAGILYKPSNVEDIQRVLDALLLTKKQSLAP